ncbi:hypothetical protein U1Q18_051095, partial [Sarracenia purpurea var. burkii]
KSIEDVFIKENMKPNQEEASSSQHNASQPFPDGENTVNFIHPKEWRYAHGYPKDLIIGDPNR